MRELVVDNLNFEISMFWVISIVKLYPQIIQGLMIDLSRRE
jgi:hypothetical protein